MPTPMAVRSERLLSSWFGLKSKRCFAARSSSELILVCSNNYAFAKHISVSVNSDRSLTAAARGAPRHDQRRVVGGSTFDSDSLVNQSTPRGTYTRAMHK